MVHKIIISKVEADNLLEAANTYINIVNRYILETLESGNCDFDKLFSIQDKLEKTYIEIEKQRELCLSDIIECHDFK